MHNSGLRRRSTAERGRRSSPDLFIVQVTNIYLTMVSKSLYSSFMKTLGSILGSAARTDILRVLCYQPESVGLRFLARVAEVHPHSAELALDALVRDGVVLYKRTPTRALYGLNFNHDDAFVLKSIFDASQKASIKIRNRSLGKRASIILPFIAEASHMISYAKRGSHVA